jgi:hypothetical protein
MALSQPHLVRCGIPNFGQRPTVLERSNPPKRVEKVVVSEDYPAIAEFVKRDQI